MLKVLHYMELIACSDTEMDNEYMANNEGSKVVEEAKAMLRMNSLFHPVIGSVYPVLQHAQ